MNPLRFFIGFFASQGVALLALSIANGRLILLSDVGASTHGVAWALLSCAVHAGITHASPKDERHER